MYAGTHVHLRVYSDAFPRDPREKTPFRDYRSMGIATFDKT